MCQGNFVQRAWLKRVLFVYRVDMPGSKPKYSEEAFITVTAKIARSQQEIEQITCMCNMEFFYMICVCNARSDWVILGDCSPVMPTSRLWPAKSKQKAIQLELLINLEYSSILNLGIAGLTSLSLAGSIW